MDVLEAAFNKTHYPDVNIIDRLAEMLNLTTERISVWFQNRRARYKRMKKNEPSPSVLSNNTQINLAEFSHQMLIIKNGNERERERGDGDDDDDGASNVSSASYGENSYMKSTSESSESRLMPRSQRDLEQYSNEYMSQQFYAANKLLSSDENVVESEETSSEPKYSSLKPLNYHHEQMFVQYYQHVYQLSNQMLSPCRATSEKANGNDQLITLPTKLPYTGLLSNHQYTSNYGAYQNPIGAPSLLQQQQHQQASNFTGYGYQPVNGSYDYSSQLFPYHQTSSNYSNTPQISPYGYATSKDSYYTHQSSSQTKILPSPASSSSGEESRSSSTNDSPSSSTSSSSTICQPQQNDDEQKERNIKEEAVAAATGGEEEEEVDPTKAYSPLSSASSDSRDSNGATTQYTYNNNYPNYPNYYQNAYENATNFNQQQQQQQQQPNEIKSEATANEKEKSGDEEEDKDEEEEYSESDEEQNSCPSVNQKSNSSESNANQVTYSNFYPYQVDQNALYYNSSYSQQQQQQTYNLFQPYNNS